MKTLLAILLCFIVSEAPVLAIHGGYTLGGTSDVEGTYAGTLIPISTTPIPSGIAATGQTAVFGSNTLGIFTIGIPSTGVGGGTLLVFSGNDQLVGSVSGIADPVNIGGITAVVSAEDLVTTFNGRFNDVVGGGQAIAQQLVAEAGGQMELQTITSLNSASPNGINISGSANLTFAAPTITATTGFLVPYENVTFAAEGYQQLAVDTIASGT